MSDIRFNQWLHQSGTGGVTQISSGHVGIGTTNPLIPVHSGNTSVLNVGIVTANNIYAGTLNGTLALSNISGITGSFTSDVTVNGNLDIADKIRHIGDTNTAIRFPSNDTITFETGGIEKVRIQPNGRVGIGTDNPPDCTLTVCEFNSGTNIYDNIALRLQGSTGQNVAVQFTDTTGAAAYIAVQGDALRLGTNNAERLRITSDGKLLVGRTSGSFALDVESASENSFRVSNSGETSHGSHDAKIVAGGTYYQNPTIVGREIKFKTFNTSATEGERLRIDPDGRLIQRYSAAPYGNRAATFQSPAGETSTYIAVVNTETNGASGILFGDHAGQNAGNFDAYINYSHQYQHLQFLVGGGTERFRIDNSGNATVMDGNLVIGTSGHGIDFSADGNATGNTSELLHDYEEGTWNATSLNFDYDGNQAQRGSYIKVGRVVHAFFRVKFHNQTHTNHLRFTGLPFTSANGNPYDIGIAGYAPEYRTKSDFSIHVQSGSAYAWWYSDTGNAYNNSTSLNGADIRGCITYTASA